MKKDNNNYVAPQIRISELDLQGFLCASIKTMKMYVEVDEYQTMEEEVIYF